MKRIAIISLTESGRVLSETIAANLNGYQIRRYCFYKHADEHAESFTDLSDLTASIFEKTDALIFLTACGIAVRMIAPLLKSKLTDPAVIAADQSGAFIIPLLSGHIGGANLLAKKIAEITGGTAVITTATDSGGLFSPDCFALQNNLLITDMDAAKEIAAAAVNGEQIGFQSDLPFQALPSPLTESGSLRCGIYVGTDTSISPFPLTLHLVPRNLVLGIGCKSGANQDDIQRAVKQALQTQHLDFRRICAVSSIDLKADEPGLRAFCSSHDLPFSTYSADELMQVSGTFTASDFVRQVTGADNVCERSAVRCSGGRLIMRKYAFAGVTVACAEKQTVLRFERTEL
ncbi:MAG: cobalt-precorrin 5A hydrolase [Oscillospiraceae bacterium]|nr:cobalt-precorrin 5A hydrolase [Oscillospiraceae bacterium]MBR3420196.1 cobalt-precorrin 5A hydrolase [Oscillospiraceae bacterium]